MTTLRTYLPRVTNKPGMLKLKRFSADCVTCYREFKSTYYQLDGRWRTSNRHCEVCKLRARRYFSI